MMKIAPIQLMLSSPFPFNNRGYTWSAKLRVGLLALGIRCALASGYVVVLVGVARTGKSVILARAFHSRIIDKKKLAMTGFRPGLLEAEVPPGAFAIDEVECLDPLPLSTCLEDLHDRTFALALQRHDSLQRMGLVDALKARKRIEITLTR